MLKGLCLSYNATGITYNIQHKTYISQALSSLFSIFAEKLGPCRAKQGKIGPFRAMEVYIAQLS